MNPQRIAIRRTPQVNAHGNCRERAQNKYEEAEGKCKQSVEICRSTIQDRKKVRSCACVHVQGLGTGTRHARSIRRLTSGLRCRLRQAATEEALKEATELEEVLQDLLAKLEELVELAAHERSAKVGTESPCLKHDCARWSLLQQSHEVILGSTCAGNYARSVLGHHGPIEGRAEGSHCFLLENAMRICLRCADSEYDAGRGLKPGDEPPTNAASMRTRSAK